MPPPFGVETTSAAALDLIVPVASLTVAVIAAIASCASARVALRSVRRAEKSDHQALKRSVRLAAHRVMATADECRNTSKKTSEAISTMSSLCGGTNASNMAAHQELMENTIALSVKSADDAERSANKVLNVRDAEELFDELVRLEQVLIHMERSRDTLRRDLDEITRRNETVADRRMSSQSCDLPSVT